MATIYLGNTLLSSASGAGGGVTVVASTAFFPEAPTVGTFAYTQNTNKMYVYNGATWILVFTATTPNNAPSFVAGPEATYLLATDGEATTIEMVAQDPEGVPITWGFTITEGSTTNGGGTTATITQVDNIITITPTTNTSHGGQFTLTIEISDGVNFANRSTKIKLNFNVQNYSYGAKLVEAIPFDQAGRGATTQKYWGNNMASHGGTLVVGGNAGSGHGVSIFDTVQTPAVAEGFVSGGQLGLDGALAIHGDVIVAAGSGAIYIISKIDGVWAIRTTWVIYPWGSGNPFPAVTMNGSNTRGAFSDDGLTFVITFPFDANGTTGNNSIATAFIFTRSDSTSIEFTKVQTIDLNTASKSFTPKAFPGEVRVSPNGKHITFAGSYNDAVSDGIMVYTNEDRANTNLWTQTLTSTGRGGSRASASNGMYVDHGTTDDNFYLYNAFTHDTFGNGIEACLFHYKYSDATNTWARYEYDPYIGLRLHNEMFPGVKNMNNFAVQENASGDLGEITFMFTITGRSQKSLNSACYLLTARGYYKDLEGRSGSGVSYYIPAHTAYDTSSILDSQPVYIRRYHPQVVYHLIGDTAYESSSADVNSGDNSPYINLTFDKITGEIFTSIPGYEPNVGGTRDGLIKRWQPCRTTGSPTTYGPFVVSGKSSYSTNYSSTLTTQSTPGIAAQIVVPQGVYEFSGVIAGAGGSTYQVKGTGVSGAGCGGGALAWFNNYPVVPGDIVQLQVAISTVNFWLITETTVWVNGVWVINAGSGQSANAGYHTPGVGGTAAINPETMPALWVAGQDYILASGGRGGYGSYSTTYTSGAGGGGCGGYGHTGGAGCNSDNGAQAGQAVDTGGAGGGWSTNGYGTYLTGADANTTNTWGGAKLIEANARYFADSLYALPGGGARGAGMYDTYSGSGTSASIGNGGGATLIFGMNARYATSWKGTNMNVRPFAYTGTEYNS